MMKKQSQAIPVTQNTSYPYDNFAINYDELLSKLRADLDSYPQFILVTNTIKKLIANIINNPEDKKYQKIKTNSQVFQNYIQVSKYCLLLFESFSFDEEFPDDDATEDSYYIFKASDIKDLTIKYNRFNDCLVNHLNN
jgi:hypothetical protein